VKKNLDKSIYESIAAMIQPRSVFAARDFAYREKKVLRKNRKK
jgi:hypothetical protein